MPTELTPADLHAAPELQAALLKLNNAHVIELSLLDNDRLAHLIGEAFMAETVGEGIAMLIAFSQDADYDGECFQIFRARYPRFVYVDRVVTAASTRGRGLARLLYRRLIDRARDNGHDRLVCEVDYEPPKPASVAFHNRMGFAEIGRAELKSGKAVALLALSLRA